MIVIKSHPGTVVIIEISSNNVHLSFLVVLYTQTNTDWTRSSRRVSRTRQSFPTVECMCLVRGSSRPSSLFSRGALYFPAERIWLRVTGSRRGATACARCLPVVGDTTDRSRTVEVLARKASLQSQIHGAYRNAIRPILLE